MTINWKVLVSLSPAYQLFSGCLLLIDDARVASILFYLSGHSALRLPTPSTCELGLSLTQNSAVYLKATKDKGFILDFDGSLCLDYYPDSHFAMLLGYKPNTYPHSLHSHLGYSITS